MGTYVCKYTIIIMQHVYISMVPACEGNRVESSYLRLNVQDTTHIIHTLCT